MGCGKSSVGKALSELLGFKHVDLDSYVEHKTDRSIREIFASDGEEYFRAVELEALRDVVIMSQVTSEDVVISLGGGTPLIQDAARILREQTFCIWLQTSPECILERLSGYDAAKGRPLLDGAGKKEIEEMISLREPHYKAVCANVVCTDGLTSAATAAIIKGILPGGE